MTACRSLAITTILSIAVVVAFALGAPARADATAQPMALQRIMEQLGRDMQAVTGAIAIEDWATVARIAPGIARHPEPPLAEKLRILKWLSGDVGKFRGFDQQLRVAATGMGDAAARGNGSATIAAFAEVQQRCLGCHQAFRGPFRQHFHDAQ